MSVQAAPDRPAPPAGNAREPAFPGWAMGPFQVDYEARVDFESLRRKRWQRVWQAMERAQLDGLLLWKDENVRYVTGHRPQLIAGKSGLLNGCLVTPGEPPLLFSSGGDADRAASRMPWLAGVAAIPILEEAGLIEHFATRILAPQLAARGLERGRVGIDLAAFRLVEALQAHFPGVRWVDGDGAMQAARRIKLPEEILLMEEAAAIAEAVTAAAVRAVAVGRRENEVAAEAMAELYRLGGEYAHVVTPFVASGEHMSPPTRLSTDKVIRYGDLVFIDIGAMWNGYYADMGRTVVCGKPSPEQRRIFRAVYDGLQACLATMRPGATNQQVADAIIRAVAAHGLERNLLSLFIGHGIGVGSNEPPYIGEVFPGAEVVELQPGMVFAVEPLVWVPGVAGGGGVRLEDTILVTETGCRSLTRFPYDETLLGS